MANEVIKECNIPNIRSQNQVSKIIFFCFYYFSIHKIIFRKELLSLLVVLLVVKLCKKRLGFVKNVIRLNVVPSGWSFYFNLSLMLFFFLIYLNSSQPVKGLYVWCQGCGHGGHLNHMNTWYKKFSVCPVAGCEHVCDMK